MQHAPPPYRGPAAYALADWRRTINELYARVRAMPDPAEARDLWLRVRSALFAHHPQSPLPDAARADFTDIATFPYDPALRFAVGLVPLSGAAIAFDLGRDGRLGARPLARTRGLHPTLGAELNVWWIEGYGGGLFIPFGDATNGTQTYGGGRYIVDAIKGADLGLDDEGRLILDFNFAYNPSCALNPAFVCPLAPRENRLPAPVAAGERAP
ncbi:DUF1684 domain-containing protein [Brevirhabdus sp.]|uniref:DUF1684 domain-containing protein n=1 Tax=Brevirhabdus sp. TaxID=2004514 RepID=UPI004059717C